ncbi:MAG TPA: hypothetical protein VGE85_16425 [Terracidiphilus sp.]|jgi:hypothetical protein
MTIAAAIEIAAGATPGQGLGKTTGAAHGSGLTGAAAQWFMASTASGAESFGEKWQSLLASLNSSNTDTDEAEANHKTLIDGSAPENTSEKSFVSNLVAGIRLHQGQGTEKERAEADSGAKLSLAWARAQTVVIEPDAGTAKPVSAKTEEIKPAATPKTESALNSHPVRSINATKEDTLPAEALTGVVSAAIASPSPVVQAAVLTNPVTYSADEKAQLAQIKISANLSTDQPAATFSASYDTQLPKNYASGKISDVVNPAMQQATEKLNAPTQNKQASPALSINGSFGQTLSNTEASAAYNSAPLPVAMLAESVAPLETSVPAMNLPTVIETSQNTDQPHSLSQDPARTSAPKPDLTQTVASNQNPASASVQSRNPMQAQVASQSITPTAVPSQSPRETQALSQNPSQTFTPDQYQTQTFVQYQEQVIPQPGKQIVSEVAVSLPNDSLKSLPVAATTPQQGQLSAVVPIRDKPGSTSNEKAITSETLRSVHTVGNFNSLQQGILPVEGQSSVSVVDSIAMARSMSGAAGTVSAASEPERASSFASAQQDTRETFATLDTAVVPKDTTWIHVGTQRAEAGFQDPALGWVSVRADLSGGGVHAQLVPGSADAAQTLSSHLAGLNSYLVEHHTPVETLTLTSPEGRWSGLGSGQSAGEGMQQGAGQQTSQGADASLSSASNPETVIQSPAPSLEPPAFFGDMNESVQAAIRGGLHISVMA